jgi:hypothetical protein
MAAGRKTGGRAKGTPNRLTAQREAEFKASGLVPLDYMLAIMRDETAALERRDDMAKAAAPYVHPKLAAVDVNAQLNGRLTFTVVSGVPRKGD